MSNEQQPKPGGEAIAQRDDGYGGFANVAATKQAILLALRDGGAYATLDHVEWTALEEIAGKLARIANGARKADNWVDISGYAELVLKHSEVIRFQLNPPVPAKRGR